MANPSTGLRQIPAMGNVGHRLSWTLKVPASGPKTHYWSVQAVDTAYAGSAWAPERDFVLPSPPVNVSLTPAGTILPTGARCSFAAVYSDPDGASSLSGCYLLINSSINGANGIYLCYSQNLNKLYLRNDAKTSWGTGYAPGSSAVLQNSQCKVYCAETTVSSSGNQIQVNWKVELRPSVSGKAVKAWMLAVDDGSLRDGWDQMASYSVSASPQNISLTPSTNRYNNYQPTPLTGMDAERVKNRLKLYSSALKYGYEFKRW
jgi:hypothetical protein